MDSRKFDRHSVLQMTKVLAGVGVVVLPVSAYLLATGDGWAQFAGWLLFILPPAVLAGTFLLGPLSRDPMAAKESSHAPHY